MLPVTHGEAYTKINIMLYTVIWWYYYLPYLTGLFASCTCLAPIARGGLSYLQ